MANFANDSTDRLPETDAPFLFMKVYASYIYVFQNVGFGPAVDPINTPAVNGLDQASLKLGLISAAQDGSAQNGGFQPSMSQYDRMPATRLSNKASFGHSVVLLPYLWCKFMTMVLFQHVELRYLKHLVVHLTISPIKLAPKQIDISLCLLDTCDCLKKSND